MIPPLSIPRALHAEISRRAAHHADRIAQATGMERHKATAQAARDCGTWLMIANELGWSSLGAAASVPVTKPLYEALAGQDLLAPPESAEDWARCRTSCAATLKRAHERAVENEHDAAIWTHLRALRAIHAALTEAHTRWLARNPETTPSQSNTPERPAQERHAA